MPSISPLEIMVVALVALVIFGPEKLPEIARTIGRYASELRRMSQEVRSEFEHGMSDDVEDERPAIPSAKHRPGTPDRNDASGAPTRVAGEKEDSAPVVGRASSPEGRSGNGASPEKSDEA